MLRVGAGRTNRFQDWVRCIPPATFHGSGLDKFSSASASKWDPLADSEFFWSPISAPRIFLGLQLGAATASHAPGPPHRDAAQVRSGVQPWPLRISPLPPSNAWELSIRPAGKRGGAAIEYLHDPLFGIIVYRSGEVLSARSCWEKACARAAARSLSKTADPAGWACRWWRKNLARRRTDAIRFNGVAVSLHRSPIATWFGSSRCAMR
jgi:hypothetical protein